MRKWILAGLLGLVVTGSAEAGPFGLFGRHRHRGGECCYQQQASQSWGYQATSGCSSCSAQAPACGECVACNQPMPAQNWQGWQQQNWQQPTQPLPSARPAAPLPPVPAPGG